MIDKKPPWVKKRILNLDGYKKTNDILKTEKVNTVCHSARCPNIHECFARSHVTFMILGSVCTRQCSFCSVKKDKIEAPSDETKNIVRAVRKLNLKYVLITSPTRDDLTDGGASYFVKVAEALKSEVENIKVEVLVPDFQGNEESIARVVESGVDVFAHNIETVKRLYVEVRPKADYNLSLSILKKAGELRKDVVIKSSIMLGLGEAREEVEETLRDLRAVGTNSVCLGQYLAPSKMCTAVKKYVTPEEFNYFYEYALNLGFKFVISQTWARSSYQADLNMSRAAAL
ncbi:MAG: lipoyl synthase [Candidatus Omnitrophota bacterium]